MSNGTILGVIKRLGYGGKMMQEWADYLDGAKEIK